jgi:hypothetical protein
MTTIELFEALKAAGVEDTVARRAAQAVLSVEDRAQLATKADLAELKADLIKWCVGLHVGTMVAMTGVFAAIVNWLVR